MTNLLYHLWAKTTDRDRDRDGNPLPWQRHPLPCHLVDVGYVAETWLDLDEHLLDRFCQLWETVPRALVRRALVLAAALHDLGKVYPEFQTKSDRGWAHGYGRVRGFKTTPKPFDHGAATARIFNAFKSRRGGGVEGVDPRWRALVPLMQIAGGHHGALYGEAAVASDGSLNSEELQEIVFATISAVTALFGEPPDVPSAPPSSFLMHAAGFVSVADWFGSDVRYFPFAPEVDDQHKLSAYLEDLRRRGVAAEALRNAGMIADLRPKETFGGLLTPDGQPEWQPKAGFQEAACALPFGARPGPEILIVEAPMGLGKTEIALYLAAQAMRHGHADGLYFALPTQATANALYDRIALFAERVKGEEDLALMLAHGARRYFDDFRRLIDASPKVPFARSVRDGSKGDEQFPSEVVAASWLLPSKRALLAPIGLGTIDQALLGAMGVRHGFVRLFGLARKVVVFDEIHAYEVYMGVLIERLLAWLGALGCKVILLSATLPEGLRIRLLRAYGARVVDGAGDYPQALHMVAGEEPRVIGDSGEAAAGSKGIAIDPVEATDRTFAGVEWVMERLDERGGCIAWIRNTVREAQEAAHALRKRGVEVDLLHARYTRRDRNEKESDLLRQFGKPAPENPDRPAARVVVATQVVEQSVDVDFDAMLSDLAPVDLLLQRAGRLWRHERGARRHGHDRPVLGVLMPAEENRHMLRFGSSVYVYDAETLARSARIVLDTPRWELPAACRELVARLYDRGEDFWTAALIGCDPERLTEARASLAKKRAAMEYKATQTLTASPAHPVPVQREAQPDIEDASGVSLATRLGSRSAAVALFEMDGDRPRPLGVDQPVTLPEADDYPARLDVEEAVMLSSVSFPWYGRGEGGEPGLSPELHEIAAWWRQTHPFDQRFFVVLHDGRFEIEGLSGTYTRELGLVLDRPGTASTDTAPFEDL